MSSELRGLSATLDSLDRRDVNISASLRDSASADLKDLDRTADRLDGRDIRMRADFDAKKALVDMDMVDVMLDHMDGRRATMSASLSGGAESAAELKVLDLYADRLDGRNIGLDVNVSGTAAAAAGLGVTTVAAEGLSGAIGGGGEGIRGAASGIRAGGLLAIVGLLGPALLGAAAGAGPLAAGITIAGVAATAAAAGLGLLAAAVVPSILQFKEFGEAQKQQAGATKEAEAAAKSYAAAQDQLRQAERGVADARRQATESVQAAQEQYVSSLDSVEEAEGRLGDAREELGSATDDLKQSQQDLNRAMQDEPLNQTEATLDLADARDRASDAQREYNQAVREYGPASEEATDAARAMERAQIDLQRAEQETQDIRKNGSAQLNQAKESVKNASMQEQNAREGVRDSEKALQQARADSQKAFEGIRKAQVDGNRQIALAQERVTEASRAVGEAASEMAKAQTKAAAAGGVLSAANRKLRDSFMALKPAYKDAFGGANKEAAEFGVELLGITRRTLPALGRESKETVGGIRQAFRTLGREMGPQEKNSLLNILDSSSDILSSLVRSAGRFGGGLANAFGIAVPRAKDLAGWIEDMSKRFLAFTRTDKKSIKEFFDSAVPVASSLAKLTGEIVSDVVAFGKRHGPQLASALDLIADSLDAIFAPKEKEKKKVQGYGNTMGSQYAGGFVKGIGGKDDEKASKNVGATIGSAYSKGFQEKMNSEAKKEGPSIGERWGKAIGGGIGKALRGVLEGTEGGPFGKDFGKGFIKGFTEAFKNFNLNKFLRDAFKPPEARKGSIADYVFDEVKKEWTRLPKWLRRNASDDIHHELKEPFKRAHKDIVGNSIVPDIIKDSARVLRGGAKLLGSAVGVVGDAISDAFEGTAKAAVKWLSRIFDNKDFSFKKLYDDGEKWLGKLSDEVDSTTKKTKDWITDRLTDAASTGVTQMSRLNRDGSKQLGDFEDSGNKSIRILKDDGRKNLTTLRDDGNSRMSDLKKRSSEHTDTLRKNVVTNTTEMKKKSQEQLGEFRDKGTETMKKAGEKFPPPVGDAAKKVREYLADMIEGMNKVIEEANIKDLKKGDPDAVRGKGGSGASGSAPGTPVRAMAEGGILYFADGGSYTGSYSGSPVMGPVGGIARGGPIRVFGEVPNSEEVYINLNAPTLDAQARQPNYLRYAAKGLDHEVIPKNISKDPTQRKTVESTLTRSAADVGGVYIPSNAIGDTSHPVNRELYRQGIMHYDEFAALALGGVHKPRVWEFLRERPQDDDLLAFAGPGGRMQTRKMRRFAAGGRYTAAGTYGIEGNSYISTPYGGTSFATAAGAHAAIDLPAPEGSPIHAVWAGNNSVVGRGSTPYNVGTDYGNFSAYYGHNSGSGKTGSVSPGDIIGYVGSLGLSSGPHVHLVTDESLQYMIDNSWNGRINPVDAFAQGPGDGPITQGGGTDKRLLSLKSMPTSGDSQPHVNQVRAFMDQVFPDILEIGGLRPGDPQDHGKGLALDYMTSPIGTTGSPGSPLQDKISKFIQERWANLATTYIIDKQRIDTGGGFEPMENRGSITENHMDHVHQSFASTPGSAFGTSALASGPGSSMGPMDLTPLIDKYFPKEPKWGDALYEKEAGAIGSMARKAIIDQLNAHAPMVGTSSGTPGSFPAASGSLKQWLEAGFDMSGVAKPTADNMAKFERLAMLESGGDPKAVQQIFDVNSTMAGAGGFPDNRARGLLQDTPQTWEGMRKNPPPDPGIANPNIFDPVKNTAIRARNQMANLGYISDQAGYDFGGLIKQDHISRVHKDEIYLPLDKPQAAEKFWGFIQEAAKKGFDDPETKRRNEQLMQAARELGPRGPGEARGTVGRARPGTDGDEGSQRKTISVTQSGTQSKQSTMSAEQAERMIAEISSMKNDIKAEGFDRVVGVLERLGVQIPEGIKDGVNHNAEKSHRAQEAIKRGQKTRQSTAELTGSGWRR